MWWVHVWLAVSPFSLGSQQFGSWQHKYAKRWDSSPPKPKTLPKAKRQVYESHQQCWEKDRLQYPKYFRSQTSSFFLKVVLLGKTLFYCLIWKEHVEIYAPHAPYLTSKSRGLLPFWRMKRPSWYGTVFSTCLTLGVHRGVGWPLRAPLRSITIRQTKKTRKRCQFWKLEMLPNRNLTISLFCSLSSVFCTGKQHVISSWCSKMLNLQRFWRKLV